MREIKIFPFEQSDNAQRFRDAVEIAADAFGVVNPTREFEEDVLHHLVNHVTGFVSVDGEAVAFGSVQLIRSSVGNTMYIAGMVVKRAHQHDGIGKRLAKILCETLSTQNTPIAYIAGRTQNPVVARARRSYCNPVYPIDYRPDETILTVAERLREHLKMDGEFVPPFLLSRNVYQNPLVRKPCGDPRIDGFFERHVGPLDAVFIIGRPNI